MLIPSDKSFERFRIGEATRASKSGRSGKKCKSMFAEHNHAKKKGIRLCKTAQKMIRRRSAEAFNTVLCAIVANGSRLPPSTDRNVKNRDQSNRSAMAVHSGGCRSSRDN